MRITSSIFPIPHVLHKGFRLIVPSLIPSLTVTRAIQCVPFRVFLQMGYRAAPGFLYSVAKRQRAANHS